MWGRLRCSLPDTVRQRFYSEPRRRFYECRTTRTFYYLISFYYRGAPQFVMSRVFGGSGYVPRDNPWKLTPIGARFVPTSCALGCRLHTCLHGSDEKRTRAPYRSQRNHVWVSVASPPARPAVPPTAQGGGGVQSPNRP